MAGRLRLAFRSFAIRDFRWFAAASLLVNTATWMQRIAQDWLAIELTGRATTVGIVTALQFLPVLLVSPFAGILADRWPRRRVLTGTGLLLAVTAAAIAAASAAHVATPPLLYGFALALGICAAIDTPARLAYVRSLTGPSQLVNAIGLSGLIFHASRVIGPAVAGFLIGQAGIAAAFVGVAACHLTATALLHRIAAREELGEAGSRPGLLAAMRVLRDRPALIVMMAVATTVCAFAMNFQVTITSMATREYGLGARAFGGLSSAMALGSMVGALTVASLSAVTKPIVFGAAAALGAAYIAGGLCHTPLAFGLALVPIGFLSNTFLATSSSLFQLSVPPAIHGRALGLYQSTSYLFVPVTAAGIGWAADLVSPRLPLAIAGVSCIAAASIAAVALRRIARSDAPLSPTTGGVERPA